MIAVFLLGTVVGALIATLTQNLARLADARRELEAAELAEQRARAVEIAALGGELPELGTTGGNEETPESFAGEESASADFAWEQVVEPFSVPMPEGEEQPPTSVFTKATPGAGAAPAGGEAAGPSLRIVRVWVHPADDDPTTVAPFVLVVAAPPEPGPEEAEPPAPVEEPEGRTPRE
jgi:hypothetical protein